MQKEVLDREFTALNKERVNLLKEQTEVDEKLQTFLETGEVKIPKKETKVKEPEKKLTEQKTENPVKQTVEKKGSEQIKQKK